MNDDEPLVFSPAREQRILGYLTQDGTAALTIARERGVTAEAFHVPRARLIFQTAEDLHARGLLEGGDPYLAEAVVLVRRSMTMAEYVEATAQHPPIGITSMELPNLCAELCRLQRRRAMASAAARIVTAVYENDPAGIAAARAALDVVDSTARPRATWAQTGQVQTEVARAVIAGRDDEDSRTIAWPFTEMDADLKPMRRAELVTIGAYTSVGKSSFMRQISLAAAVAEKNVAFVSLEVPASDIFNQLAAAKSNQPWSRLRGLHPNDQADFLVGCGEVGRLPIAVLDSETSLDGILAWLRAEHQRRFLDLIVIDYLGLCADCRPTKYATKASAVGEVAAAFKRIATELGAVVVLGVQLNRSAQTAGNRTPSLSDLRDSGDIESHSDRVLLLHRPDVDKTTGQAQGPHDLINDRPRFFMQLYQEKGRNAGTGYCSLWFARELAKFELIQQ